MLRNIFSAALFAVIMVILVAGNAQAQTLVNADLSGSATVYAALSIVETTPLAFGNVPASRTAVLDPKDVANSYVGSTHTVGVVTITGGFTKHVLVSWPPTMTLTDGSVPEDLTLTLNVRGNSNPANQGTSSALSSTADVITSAAGNYTLWIGGSLPTGANANTFTGTANFTVEYQ